MKFVLRILLLRRWRRFQPLHAVYDCLGCRGIVRVDYFLCDDGSIVFLELNTVPGMTAMSLVPQQIRAAGLDMMQVITGIADIT